MSRYVIETWRFIEDCFKSAPSLGIFDTEDAAIAAMWAEIRASGKDMSRFRIASETVLGQTAEGAKS